MWNRYRTRWSSGVSKWEYFYEDYNNKNELIKSWGGKKDWNEEYYFSLIDRFNINSDGEHFRGIDIEFNVKAPEERVKEETEKLKSRIKAYEERIKKISEKD
jgi:hypothetical protein